MIMKSPRGIFAFVLIVLIIISGPGVRGGASGPLYSPITNPAVLWNTFAGGTGDDGASGIAVDTSGNTYVTGNSYAAWGILPVRAYTGSQDAFIAKFDRTGTMLWNTFLGGSGNDWGAGIVVDSNGNAYIAGGSYSTWGAPVRPYAGNGDAFIAKVDTNGVLQWNTFLGGSGTDGSRCLALDVNGNLYTAGKMDTASWGTPVEAYHGGADAFTAKLNSSGGLEWNTFQGTTGSEWNNGIAVDLSGNVYISGGSNNGTWGSPIRAFSEGLDAHVAKLNGNGVLQWNTFLGGTALDYGENIAVDGNGSVYTTGYSEAAWGSPIRAFSGGYEDGYVSKLNGNGVLQWNTFLGGDGSDECRLVAVASNGDITINGSSSATWGSPGRAYSGINDVFAAQLDSTGALKWNIFLGGSKAEFDGGMAQDAEGTVYVSGKGNGSWGNPVTEYAGGYDIMVAVVTDAVNVPEVHLSRTSLNFGASVGTVATGNQNILITNPQAGILHWTATPAAAWITVSPGSGTGEGTASIGVDITGLAPGTYNGTASIADPAASNSPQTVAIHLTVYAAGTTVHPFGDFATPLEGTTGITGAIPVTGWILDDVETTKVEIWRDAFTGETPGLWFIGTAIFVEGARPDVEADYPNYPLNYKAGWGYMLLTNFLPAQGNGTFKLYAIATDKEGNAFTLGTKTITCDNAHASKPFGTIDTPAQGGDASGDPFLNFGWVLTPQPKTVPKNGSTISVYVDSVPVGNLSTAPNVYNQYRPDVSGNFPGLNNTGAPGAGGPVGAYFLGTTSYTNGVHTIYWIAYDDAGAGDGIGSRYFNIVNTNLTSPRPATEIGAAALAMMPRSYLPVRLTTGLDLKAEPNALLPDEAGIYHIGIPEIGRIELELGEAPEPKAIRSNPSQARYSGQTLVGNAARRLPIGSTLDARTGRFAWMPGPGFVGKYDLVFIRRSAGEPLRTYRVEIEITPKKF
jgi:hypothetical protein